jgi:predicted amidohydrolase YtcJ
VTPALDLMIFNAGLWSRGSRIEGSDAIGVVDGSIVAVGPRRTLEDLCGPRSRRIDARGGTVTPGICDAHLHLVAWARSLHEVRLDGLGSRQAVIDALLERAHETPEDLPLIGRGWASDGWDAPPDREVLDAAMRDREVLLHSRDYHALWVNSAAMASAGIHRGTADPPGGLIERRPSGEPTGVFREHAARFFDGLIPVPAVETDLGLVQDAVERLLSQGVTSVHDFEGDAEADVLQAMSTGGGPRLRVLMHRPKSSLERLLEHGSPLGDEWFAWGALKLFADGTLGSRTASMLEPYDGTEERGLTLIPPDELKGLVGRSVRGGLSVAIHAIGDHAVRVALDAFESCGSALGRLRLPPRIEHAQLVDDSDMRRFVELGVAASMQPQHCVTDRPLVERLWSQRVSGSYPWRTLLDAGATLAFGSDAPVEPPVPSLGLHAAVTREGTERPGDSFVPAQRIALDEALTAYTETPARLSAQWPRCGSLAPGSVADLVVWDGDLHRLAPSQLPEAEPAFTVLSGQVVFERAGVGAASGSQR